MLVVFGLGWCGHKAQAAYGDVSTYLGKPYDGDGGQAISAYFDFPEDVVVDANNNLIVADTANHVIRKIDTKGIVTTLAGTGSYGDANGAATAAEFASPRGVVTDTNGNVYVADSENNQIRKIDRYGAVSALASGLSNPQGVDVYGGYVYIADTGSNSIKRLPAAGGAVQTVASNLSAPKKISIDSSGTYIYVADSGSHKVKRVNLSTGDVVDIAGSGNAGYVEGTGAAASFNNIWGVEYYNNKLYVTDGDGYTDFLRVIDLSNSTTSLLAQDAVMATLNFPSGLVVSNNYIYVANSGIGTIRRFSLADPSNVNEDIAGANRFNNRDGAAAQVLLGRPWDMVLSPDRQWLYVAENNKIRRINYATGDAIHLIGSVVDNYREGDVTSARFSNITSLAINSDGSTLYLTDRWNNRIRKVELATSISSLVAGGGLINSTGEQNNGYAEGVGDTARFDKPAGIAISPDNKYLYISDSGNNRIRRITIASGETVLIAGGSAGFTDGAGGEAKFNKPYGLSLDKYGENLYVADTNNHAIRKISLASNMVSTLVGTGSAGYNDAIGRRAVFSYPEYLRVDTAGNIYVTEAGSHRVRLIEKDTLITKLVAGSGERGYHNGARAVAEFNNPKGMLIDGRSNIVMVADSNDDVIRQVNIQGTAPFTEAGPEITNVSPNTIALSWDKGTGLRVNIFGKNFRHGAAVKFGQIDATKTYVVKSTELVIELPVKQLSTGWYDVSVTNTDGQSASLYRGLGVKTSTGASVPNIDHPLDEKGSFYAYSSKVRGGYFAASGNVMGTSAAEIVVGTDRGLGPQVRVFSGTGMVLSQFFAYAQTLRSGVRVATCDTNNDGYDEIITVPGKGGRPQVRIFNGKGTPIGKGFFALDGKFTGGANIACGDVNGDSRPEIIVAAGPGGGPHVTIHKSDGTMLTNFMAYAKNFKGGIVLAAIDIDGNGSKEIITAPEKGAPHLQMFTGKGKRMNPGIYAFSRTFGGGLSIAGGDVDGDGIEEILTTPGPQSQALLKIFKNSGQTLSKSFYLYPKTFTGAAHITSGDVNDDGLDEIIAVPYSNSSPMVKIYNQNGALTE
jgi:DNA-binding beta-propeller fold protein YncE